MPHERVGLKVTPATRRSRGYSSMNGTVNTASYAFSEVQCYKGCNKQPLYIPEARVGRDASVIRSQKRGRPAEQQSAGGK